MRKLFFYVLLSAVAGGSSLHANPFYVSKDGDDQNSGLTWESAKSSIQGAIDAAGNGDLIIVSNGTYTGTGSYAVNINKSLTIESVNGPAVTIIDGEEERRCVYSNITTGGDPLALSGFTLTRGLAALGGGIYKSNYRDLYVTNCLIHANQSTSSGGGVYKLSNRGQMLMYACIISNNSANGYGGGVAVNGIARLYMHDCEITHNTSSLYYGGGISNTDTPTDAGVVYELHGCRIACNSITGNGGGASFQGKGESRALLNSCLIESNSVTGTGAGVMRRSGSTEFTISNCVIRGNTSTYGADQVGAGILLEGASRVVGCLVVSNQSTNAKSYGIGIAVKTGTELCVIENTTVTGNIAENYCGGIQLNASVANCIIRNCITYGNIAPFRNDMYLIAGASAEITRSCLGVGSNIPEDADVFYDDPLFVNSENGNYRLLPDSPCVNSGITLPWMAEAVDLDGHPRLDRFSKTVDLGCYEYLPSGILFKIR